MEKNFDYPPFWWGAFTYIANWSPLIYLSVLCFTMLDKVLTVFILFQASVTKSIFNGIQKADHKIWRKTGKDSYIANKIWWVQQKWMGIDKKNRQRIMVVGFIVFMLWYVSRLLT